MIETLLVLSVIALLIEVAYEITRLGFWEIGDRISYWLGVAGGVTMLLILLYPVRKYVRFFFRFGEKMKIWLYAHMIGGVVGPLLILLHSNFHLKSVNATVAMWCMFVVFTSGLMGRFLFKQSTIDAVKEAKKLKQFREEIRLDDPNGLFWFADHVRVAMLNFEDEAIYASRNAAGHWLNLLFRLPLRSWYLRFWCIRQLKNELLWTGRRLGWASDYHRQQKRFAEQLVIEFFTRVMKLALFRGWNHVFALWHIAHIPVVMLLVVTSIFHIVAVHVY